MVFSKKKFVLISITLMLAILLTFGALSTLAIETNKTSGKTYYVSSTNGNDSNNGLSETSPFKSIKKISEIEFKSGDSVLLKKGDVWIGETLTFNCPTGTEDSYFKIGTYGNGDKPKLQMFEKDVPKYSKIPVIKPINADHLIIDGFDIGYAGVGIDIHYEMTTNNKNVKIKNCDFHDIYGFTQSDKSTITEYPHSTSIVVTSIVPFPGNSDPVINGLYIDNCSTYDASALYTYGTRIGSSGQNVKNLYVTNCEMKNNGIYGIAVCAMTGGYMDNCKIVDCGSRNAPMGSMGVMISGNDFTIMNSEICFQQRLEKNPDGGGIDFEHLGYDCDIINCYIHDNSGCGIMMYSSHGDSSHQNKRVRLIGNVFENNNQNVFDPGGAEILSLPLYSLVDGAIYNNRYMESDNMFTMSMDASVDIKGNVSYPKEKQGKMWPVYDFDDVRNYVINGKPLPTLEVQKTENESIYNFVIDYGNYFIGVAIGIVVLLLLSIIKVLFIKKKKIVVTPLIVLLIMVSVFIKNPAVQALGVNRTENNGFYSLSQMCNDKTNLWTYYWFDGTDYNEMFYDNETSFWKGNSPANTAMISGSKYWHPYISGYTVAKFTCPKSGTVKISTEKPLELSTPGSSSDGIMFVVMSDDKLIGDPIHLDALNPKKDYETTQIDVYEGQEIGFYLNMYVNNAGDSTVVTPCVEYIGYKDVNVPDKKSNIIKPGGTEKTLRTDIKPAEIKEDIPFVIDFKKILVSLLPVLVLGFIIMIINSIKTKKRERGK